MAESALGHLRICDFTGQLAGAGATRFLAAFGAQVIRIEDPTNQGRWDILRGGSPYVDERRGIDLGGAFNNHNVEKLGITLNLRAKAARETLIELVRISDVVSENFASGVMARLGFHYEQLRQIRPDIIYVSNCGFGHTGPYAPFKTWGPSVQAVSGLTFQSGLPDQPPAGWGYSYMDHTGAYYMAMAILAALYYRERTGEGQWVDMATTEAAATLNGPALLDYTVNGRPLRRPGMPNSNRDQWNDLVPHGIFPTASPSEWVAILCDKDGDWEGLCDTTDEAWFGERRHWSIPDRLQHQDEIEEHLAGWTCTQEAVEVVARLRGREVPSSLVASPEQRIDHDPNTAAWELWPMVEHAQMGQVRVDGLPVHLSATDWSLQRGAPCLGEHNECVLGQVLGYGAERIAALRKEGAL